MALLTLLPRVATDYGDYVVLSYRASAMYVCSVASPHGACTVKVWTDVSGANLIELTLPYDVAHNEMGDILIADHGNHRVLLCSATGAQCSVVAGTGGFGSGATQLRFPLGVALDHVGSCLVCDRGNNRGSVVFCCVSWVRLYHCRDGGPARESCRGRRWRLLGCE